jgi:glutamyl-tRNA synthetase
MDVEQACLVLAASQDVLGALSSFDEALLEKALRATVIATELKPRQFFGTLRIAVSGKPVAPPLFGTLAILGRDKVLQRLARADELLSCHTGSLPQEM